MNNRMYITILNLVMPLLSAGLFSSSLALETMPDLDISFHIEKSVKNLKRKGASMYAQAGLALVTAEDMQERIDTMLQVRHTVDRTLSQAEYVTFVCHAVNTSARATMHEIITILDTIASSITYWQQQQGHKISYFFHKNPVKLATGKAQSAEIREHLDALYALQKTYFSHLGTIAQQVQAIPPVCATADDQQPIMQRIAHAMSTVVGVSNTSDTAISPDLLIDDTVKALYQVPLYIKRAQREIKPHTVPLWVTRNWLPAGAALAGSALSIYWYLQTKQKAHGWIDAKQAKLKPVAGKACADVIGLANRVDDMMDASNKIVTDVGVQTMVNVGKFIDKDGLIDQAGEDVGARMTDFELLFETEGLTKIGLGIWQLPGGALVSSQLAAIYNNISPFVERLGGSVRAWRTYAVDSTKEIGQWLQTNAPERVQRIEDKIKGVQHGVKVFNGKVLEYAPKINGGIDVTSRISKNMVTFGLPIVGLASIYCGYKLTKSIYATVYPLLFPAPNYQYVRQSLQDLSRLLNINQHVSTLSVDSLGALVYHVHTLQKTAVPGEWRDQFNADVTELASADYTREQKTRTIDRMYRSYDFLAVTR